MPTCLLYAQDAELSGHVGEILSARVQLHPIDEPQRLDQMLHQTGPTVLLIDLRVPNCREIVLEVKKAWPYVMIVGLSAPRSKAAHDAESLDLFAIEDPMSDRRRFQNLVSRALDFVQLQLENHVLRNEIITTGYQEQSRPRLEKAAPGFPLHEISRVFRHFDDTDSFLRNIIDSIAHLLMVSRVGIFAKKPGDGMHRFQSGLKVSQEARVLEFPPEHPLVMWLQVNARMISRHTVSHEKNFSEKILLTQSLNLFGAEAILPLLSGSQMLGWIFIGQRATGAPFQEEDFQNLVTVAEHVTSTLERAYLQQEIALQNTQLEALFHSLPIGLVGVNADGLIQCVNRAAQQMLHTADRELLRHPIEILGPRLSDLLRKTLDDGSKFQPLQWTDTVTNRSFSVQTRMLTSGDQCLGALAFLQDVTTERILKEKQEQLEHAVSVADLVDQMSHEIRNPLVAIKTFGQLLSERRSDQEFCDQFAKLVVEEVERLDRLTERINRLVYRTEFALTDVNIPDTLQRSLDLALQSTDSADIKVETMADKNLPVIRGDEEALVECFAHVIANAIEASIEDNRSQVQVRARASVSENERPGVLVTVKCTAKGWVGGQEKRAAPAQKSRKHKRGLGLEIVQDTVVSHSGRLNIDTSEGEMAVSILLPCH